MITERELLLRRAATKAAYGESVPDSEIPDPIEPTEVEKHYQYALECFRNGQQCAAWDHVDAGDLLCGESQLTAGYTQESTPGDYYAQKARDAEAALKSGDKEALERARYVGD
jgi:hypothetical protein